MPAGWARKKAGWPSTCSSSAWKIPWQRHLHGAAPSPAPAARPTWRCWFRRWRTRASGSGRSVTTSPGCASARTARLWAVNPETASSASLPAPTPIPIPMRCRALAQHHLHQRRADAGRACPGGRASTSEDAAQGTLNWHGRPWTARCGSRRAPQFALHRAGQSVPIDLAALGRSAGRADLRLHLRRAARECGPAGLPVVQLAAWRLRRRGMGSETTARPRARSA